MTAAAELLSQLKAKGVEVQAFGDRLRLRPAEALDSELLETVRQHKREIIAVLGSERPACGSPSCAGCYEVEPGVRLHPPRSGPEWKEWLLKWDPKGKVQ